MLTICLACNSKLFSAGAVQRTCEACGSARVAIVSARALFDSPVASAVGLPGRTNPPAHGQPDSAR